MAALPIKRQGEVIAYAEVDDVDYLWASQYSWHLTAGYAARAQRRGKDCKPFRMFLHREVQGVKHGYSEMVVDHINGDKLDCRRDNLRLATRAQNSQNRRSHQGSSSKHRGVHWYTSMGCWRVAIMVNGVRTVVGYFDDEEEAARAAQNFYSEHMPFAVSHSATAPGAGEGNPTTYSPSAGPGRASAITDQPPES